MHKKLFFSRSFYFFLLSFFLLLFGFFIFFSFAFVESFAIATNVIKKWKEKQWEMFIINTERGIAVLNTNIYFVRISLFISFPPSRNFTHSPHSLIVFFLFCTLAMSVVLLWVCVSVCVTKINWFQKKHWTSKIQNTTKKFNRKIGDFYCFSSCSLYFL